MPPTRTAQKSIHRDTYIYKQIGANAIELDVMGLRSDMTQPCVVWIHGGGLIFGWRKTSPRESFLRSLLERGFVIISIDHRLAPETRLPAIIEDVQDAWAWLHEFAVPRLGIDPMRLAMAGASSGGYLALLAGYLFDPRPRALASLWGFGDITGAWEAEPSQHYRQMALVTRQEAEASLCGPVFDEVGVDRSSFYLYCRQQGRWLQEVTGHDPAKTPRWFDRYCPIRNVNRTFPPTILVHGDADTDVPHEESARLAARFGEVGVRHRFISLNAVGHGFENASPALAETVEREVADFLITALA